MALTISTGLWWIRHRSHGEHFPSPERHGADGSGFLGARESDYRVSISVSLIAVFIPILLMVDCGGAYS